MFSDGRPRSARRGTLDFNWLGVRGCASESAFAAAVIALSSSTVSIAIAGRFDIFDIVFHLSTIGAAQADGPSRIATVNKCRVVQNGRLWGQRDHSRLAILEAVINPHKCSFPIAFSGNRQRDTVLLPVRYVFREIELNSHGIAIATVKRDVKRSVGVFPYEAERQLDRPV